MINYLKNIIKGFSTILVGMKVTFINLFRPNVTVQYPNVHPLVRAGSDKMPDNARNKLNVIIPKCTGCKSCEKACPVNCITIETTKVASIDTEKPLMEDGKKRVFWLSQFDIDFAKCCFCGLCTIACPTSAIVHSTDFEYSCYDRNELLVHFSPFNKEQVAEKKRILAEEVKQKAEKALADKQAAEKAAQEQNITDSKIKSSDDQTSANQNIQNNSN